MNSQVSTSELRKLRAENVRLREENAMLKKKSSANPKHRRRSPWEIVRKFGVVLLVSFSVALLTVANLLFWFGNTIVKQDRFVAATQPIIKDSAVQNSMALYTTNAIFNNVDVQQFTEQALPPRADFLAPQLTNQLKSFTQSSINKVVANPNFQDKWNNLLATQHQRLVSFASKYQGNGDISLNDAYQQLSASLSTSKLSFLANKKLPPKVGDITVVNASWLPAFHNVVVHIDTWRLLAVILLVISVVAAVWLSRNRRRTIYVFAVASAVMMVVSFITLHIIKGNIIDKVDPQYATGVSHAMQIFFHPLVIQSLTILLAAIFVWVVTWVSGPARSAVIVRDKVGLLFSGKLHGQIFASDNRYTIFVQRNKHLLEWGAVTVIAAIMLLTRLTLTGLMLYILLMAAVILTIEVIGGQTPKTQIRT